MDCYEISRVAALSSLYEIFGVLLMLSCVAGVFSRTSNVSFVRFFISFLLGALAWWASLSIVAWFIVIFGIRIDDSGAFLIATLSSIAATLKTYRTRTNLNPRCGD